MTIAEVEYRSHITSPPGRNGCVFADDIFRCILVNEKFCISVKDSLNFVSWGSIDNDPALVQIMAWCRIADKPLSEPMLTWFTDEYMGTRGDELKYCSLVMPYRNLDMGQHWLSYWLVALWHQAVTCTNLDFSLVTFTEIDLKVIAQWVPK